jgi:colanic acid/amylovoran biosynthesis glycosyltransferase
MKIAYVLYAFPQLSESFILNEIVELLKRGHVVQIFSMHEPMEGVMHDDVKEYQLLERNHYFRRNQIFAVNFFKVLKYSLKALVHDLYNLKISKYRLKQDLKLAYFSTIMDENGVELIHAHFANMGSIARRLGKMLKLPYTLTAHAFDIYMYPDTDELRKVMNDAELVVMISDYNKNYLRDEIGVNNKIEVIRCGIDLDKFNSKKLKADDSIRLLTVARFVEKKGIAYLIKAIPMMIKEVSNCELILIGSGLLYDTLQQLVRDQDIGRYVQFKGDVSDSELMQFYEDADLFILPCIITENGDRDGIPVALMEAMAMKLPVISTTVSGIPELVDEGASGILVPPKDEKAIADAIIALCKDGALRVKMGKEGREIIERKFNIIFEAEKLIGVFDNVIEHR